MTQEGFASASEYFRFLVREAQKRRARQEFDDKLLEGIQSPDGEMTKADWEDLRQRISERSPEVQAQG
ncbi:MAG: hypothetical protein NVSMB14_15650 [Isosphaeraceae bacterium]